MLLAGLKTQAVAGLAGDVAGRPDQAPRRLSQVLLASRQEPEVRPAVGHRIAQRLAVAHDDVGSAGPRRLQQPARDRIDRGDHQRARVLGQAFQLGEAAVCPRLGHLDRQTPRVGLQHLPRLRMDRLRDDHPAPAGDRMGHHGRFGTRRRLLVERSVADVHPRELADHGLELVEGLEAALGGFGLIGGVGGHELAAG